MSAAMMFTPPLSTFSLFGFQGFVWVPNQPIGNQWLCTYKKGLPLDYYCLQSLMCTAKWKKTKVLDLMVVLDSGISFDAEPVGFNLWPFSFDLSSILQSQTEVYHLTYCESYNSSLKGFLKLIIHSRALV